MPSMNRRVSRREAIGVLGAAGLVAAVGCGSPTDPTTTSSSSTSSTTTGSSGGSSGTSACAVAPEETAGPYPDRLGMINNSSFFRQDITEGKSGLALTLTLTVVNVKTSCTPVNGASVEIWQCDAAGHYSEYSQPGYDGTGQTFLRGVQTTDGSGRVTFRTIYPGWYAGRATHIHVDVFVNGANVKTTQIAFPEDVSSAIYRTGVYATKGQNTTTNSQDNVFSDGTSGEMAALSGDTTNGYAATLTIGVSV
jgi:protocatechuate 3,4-dioxygenase beta subunit